MDPDAIATQFITSYYQLFDTDRAKLAALYVSSNFVCAMRTCDWHVPEKGVGKQR